MSSRALTFTMSAAGAAALAALVLASCGGGGSSTSSIPPPPPTPTPSPTAGAFACHFTAAGPMLMAMAMAHRVGRYALRPPAPGGEPGSDIMPDVVAVRFASADDTRLRDAVTRVGGEVRTGFDAMHSATISLPHGADPRFAASRLRGLPGIVSAGLLVMRHLEASQVIPNDPDFGTLPYTGVPNNPIQWDMYVTNMPQAWALPTSFGSSSVIVALIDTGYDKTNTDLVGRVSKSIVFDKGNGTVDSTASVQDGDGHGTDTSGILAADTNDGSEVAGTAGGVTLIEARVFPTPSAGNPTPGASTQDVGAAIDWARTNGAKVISMSIGSGTPDNLYEEPAVANAIAAGITVVAAAGNSGLATLDYPAADPNVIAVGASALCDQAGARNYQTAFEYVASYSNYVLNPPATQYYVVAPGADPSALQVGCKTNACLDFLQWSTNLYSNTARVFPGPVALLAGTSMATPHVAGLAALMLSKDPALSPQTIAQTILANTHTIMLPGSVSDPKQGHGRIDAFATLNATP